MEKSRQKILVVGAGKSGIASSKFLSGKNFNVYLYDGKTSEELAGLLEELASYKITPLFDQTINLEELKPEFIVTSPGVSLTIPLLVEAKALKIPIIGEMELAFKYSKSDFIAITGTNGKTTTTALCGQILEDAGKNVLVGGNIGNPLISEISDYDKDDIIIAETSSFQLETVDLFKAKVAIILNLTPDHLDRHKTMEEYIRCKANVFKNQTKDDFLILNYDDLQVRELSKKAKSKIIFFSCDTELEEGIYVKNEVIYEKLGATSHAICKTSDLKIKGKHNLENALAAIAAALIMGLERGQILKSLKSFPGVHHRLEPFTKLEGVTYVNDSKGTNPDASIKALEAFKEPIVLIAGGRNKGSDFSQLASKIKEKVKELILVGESKEEIKNAVLELGFNNYHLVDTYEQAVNKAYQLASADDVVLLSPACASWDMFNSFEERGDCFKELVMNLGR